MTDSWKKLAWNGIHFNTPDQWEVAQIGTRHLILEDETGPVMEIKWGLVKGTFSSPKFRPDLKGMLKKNLTDPSKLMEIIPVPGKEEGGSQTTEEKAKDLLKSLPFGR